MLTNEYLYGDVEVPEVDPLMILRRLELLDDNLVEVNAVHYKGRDYARRDAILSAMEFWLNINKENK